MASSPSEPPTAPGLAPADDLGVHVPDSVSRSLKILVAGGFGVGKTTLIGAVSEITPLRTEETITAASIGVDDLAGMEHKTTTTAALDFGRLTVAPEMVLYLFGAPGQQRYWELWEGLAEGAIGALVLVDSRRLDVSFEVLGWLERRLAALPLAVAVNHFPDTRPYPLDELRQALDLDAATPLINCRAPDRTSAARALVTLATHARSLQKVHP